MISMIEMMKDSGYTDLQVATYIQATDERLNYTFIKPENIEKHQPKLPELIERNLFDYSVVIAQGEPETEDSVGTLDTIAPISYASIKSPEEGEEWYRMKYPELPEEFYGIISRYTWGVPFTKKEVKNETKKIKKGKKASQGFSMIKGKFEVDFD